MMTKKWFCTTRGIAVLVFLRVITAKVYPKTCFYTFSDGALSWLIICVTRKTFFCPSYNSQEYLVPCCTTSMKISKMLNTVQ